MKQKQIKKQCPEFPYFGATYPDARCIDGYLHDLDACDEKGNLYVMQEQHPCPFCNTEEFLKDQKANQVPMRVVKKWMKETHEKYS